MLSLQIYSSPDKNTMLADFTHRVQPEMGGGGYELTTNEHGFGSLHLPLVPMTLDEAAAAYSWPGTPWAVVSDQWGGVVWEGRVEDIGIVDGGLELAALGAAAAMSDVLYTALWSGTQYGDWRVVTNDDRSPMNPAKFRMDNGDRLYMAPLKNNTFDNVNQAGWTIETPHNGERTIVSCSFDWATNSGSGTWLVQLLAWSRDYTALSATVWSQALSGAAQSGSQSLMFTGVDRLEFRLVFNTGTSANYGGETGTLFAKITNLRIKTTTASSVVASSIATDLVGHVNGINSSQLNSGTQLIETTADDLTDELYMDERPSDILDRLALLHGFEWGVWENQLLHFRALGSWGKTYYVDVANLTVQRSLSSMTNQVYATYKDGNGRILRTAVADDAFSQERFGLIRQSVVQVNSTDSTQAETHRDTMLADAGQYAVRVAVDFDRLETASGGMVPLYALRSGDTLVLRNLPLTLTADVDHIRSFRVRMTRYGGAGRMQIEPAVPVPTLVTLVAREGAGV